LLFRLETEIGLTSLFPFMVASHPQGRLLNIKLLRYEVGYVDTLSLLCMTCQD
jgi:hypothetical protein